MIVICAWCRETLGEKQPLEDKSVSHGICKACEQVENKKSYSFLTADRAKYFRTDCTTCDRLKIITRVGVEPVKHCWYCRLEKEQKE